MDRGEGEEELEKRENGKCQTKEEGVRELGGG